MDRTTRNYNEKRNFIRMQIDTPAAVILDNGGEKVQGICRDLSGGGLLIESARKLPLGQDVEVHLASHHVESPMLKAKAKVARCQVNQSGTFTLGLEILEMLD